MPCPRGRAEALAALFAYYVATGKAPAWKRIRLDTSLPSEWTVRRFWQESLHAACKDAGIPEEAFLRTLDRAATKVRNRPEKNGQAIRTCLRCEGKFKSEGNHNRLCGYCRNHAQDDDGISDRYHLVRQHWRSVNPLAD